MSRLSSRGSSKLFGFKRWLSLSEAADYLSHSLDEHIGPSDVLRLGIDRHLTLSVRFVNSVTVSIGHVVPMSEAKHEMVPTLDGEDVLNLLEGVPLGPERVVVFDEESIVSVSDLWDLTMVGAERLDAERLFQGLVCGPEVEMVSLEGPILRRGAIYCRLMTRFRESGGLKRDPADYCPADHLPSDAEIVLRPEALREFQFDVLETAETPAPEPPSKETPLGQRERNTLLVLIAALADLGKVDIRRPSSAAAAIEAHTERLGARVAARTIEEHLKRVPDALEAKRT